MRKVIQGCAILIAQMLLLSPSYAQTRDISVHGDLLDRIAAIVNDGLVLKSELDSQMESVQKRLMEQKVELPSQNVLQQQVLDRLVLQEIQLQRAKHVGLTITDEQLNGALQEIAAPQQDPLRSAADRARGAGGRLQGVPRIDAQGIDLEHPAATRRDRAYQCLAA